jgi:hypothetical protein
VSAEGKIGPYVTFSGGKMVDSGLLDSASASVKVGPVTGSVGAEARLSLETGVSTDVSTGLSFGAGVESPATTTSGPARGQSLLALSPRSRR